MDEITPNQRYEVWRRDLDKSVFEGVGFLHVCESDAEDDEKRVTLFAGFETVELDEAGNSEHFLDDGTPVSMAYNDELLSLEIEGGYDLEDYVEVAAVGSPLPLEMGLADEARQGPLME